MVVSHSSTGEGQLRGCNYRMFQDGANRGVVTLHDGGADGETAHYDSRPRQLWGCHNEG